MHHAHQGLLVYDDGSRLLESLDELETLVGMFLWNIEVFGGLNLLRIVSRYCLSPPGVLFWALGVNFCVL